MIDAALLPWLARLFGPPARALSARGVKADQITIAGFVIGVLAVPALAAGWFGLALALIAANRLADGLDGALARINGPTDRGAFLDISLDFMFYALIPVGFALADMAANGIPAAVLIAAFMGTGSSFLAFSVIAERRGLTSARYPKKGIFYLGGLTEGAETVGLFVASCLWPGAFPVLALVFAGLCMITTATRWLAGWQAFADD